MSPTAQPRLRRRAFTLVELLTVVTIILILAGMVFGISSFSLKYAREKRCKAQIKMLEMSLTRYRDDWGYFPQGYNDATGDTTLDEDLFWDTMADKTGSPYLDFDSEGFEPKGTVYADPWENYFYYKAPGDNNTGLFDLWSVGPDGIEGNDDDIRNWERMY